VAEVTRAPFGVLADGRFVDRLTIAAGDLSAQILTLGAILQDVRLKGTCHSLTAGSETLAYYQGPLKYHGAIVGPVANRIGPGRITIDSQTYQLATNENGNTLHGAAGGTHDRLWEVADHAPDRLTLRLTLAHLDGGFPGDRQITATYRIEPPASLTLTIKTETDRPTLANLANHSYWQLGPDPTATQTLTCPAETRIALDAALLATGETTPVEGTPFDFRASAPVGRGQYDLCLCLALNRRPLTAVATLAGGDMVMTLETTEAGLQIHDGAATGGTALEAQNWTGAAQHAHFPSDRLNPGETLTQTTRWSFARR
jgi:aldose 1-epimerase